MKLLCEQFVFLSAVLNLLEQEVNIEEAGLTIAEFEKIDSVLIPYLNEIDVQAYRTEIIELAKTLVKAVDEKGDFVPSTEKAGE